MRQRPSNAARAPSRLLSHRQKGRNQHHPRHRARPGGIIGVAAAAVVQVGSLLRREHFLREADFISTPIQKPSHCPTASRAARIAYSNREAAGSVGRARRERDGFNGATVDLDAELIIHRVVPGHKKVPGRGREDCRPNRRRSNSENQRRLRVPAVASEGDEVFRCRRVADVTLRHHVSICSCAGVGVGVHPTRDGEINISCREVERVADAEVLGVGRGKLRGVGDFANGLRDGIVVGEVIGTLGIHPRAAGLIQLEVGHQAGRQGTVRIRREGLRPCE